MRSELYVWRVAKLYIDQHSEKARIAAAMRADAMLDKGDLEGVAVWKAILKAINEMANMEPDRTVH